MYTLTVLAERSSSAAISDTVSMVGRYRSTWASRLVKPSGGVVGDGWGGAYRSGTAGFWPPLMSAAPGLCRCSERIPNRQASKVELRRNDLGPRPHMSFPFRSDNAQPSCHASRLDKRTVSTRPRSEYPLNRRIAPRAEVKSPRPERRRTPCRRPAVRQIVRQLSRLVRVKAGSGWIVRLNIARRVTCWLSSRGGALCRRQPAGRPRPTRCPM
jgi:hypothetical protein